MSRADTFTDTERDAGLYEQSQAYEVDEREHDEPTGPIVHECTSPNPERCLLCVLDKVVAEQKAARR